MKKEIPSDTLLANIDRRYIQSKIENIIDSNGYHTAYRVRSRLKSIFDYAVQYSYIENNEVNYTVIPKKPETLEDIEKSATSF